MTENSTLLGVVKFVNNFSYLKCLKTKHPHLTIQARVKSLIISII